MSMYLRSYVHVGKLLRIYKQQDYSVLGIPSRVALFMTNKYWLYDTILVLYNVGAVSPYLRLV